MLIGNEYENYLKKKESYKEHMSCETILIEKDFYELVEKPDYLRHIIYGDSVTGDGYVDCIYHNERINIQLEDLWNKLTAEFRIEIVEDKEYIFFPEGSEALKIQTSDLTKDQIIFVVPKYLMRHKYVGLVYNNYLTNNLKVSTTLNHSFVEVNMKDRTFRKTTPEKIQIVPIVDDCQLRVPLKYSLIYGHETKYDFYGAVRNTRTNRRILNSIRPWKLCKKNKTDFNGYVYDFEVPETHVFIVNNVLLHNTDSLFIEIPVRPEDTKEKIKLVNQTSSEINQLIVNYNKSFLLPRCGFSPERNETNFKEEMVIDKIVMLDVKKSYAYRQISSEAKVDPKTNELVKGYIFETPEIKKKSGLGVKTDTIDLTKTILDFLIQTALNDQVPTKEKYAFAIKELRKFREEFEDCLTNLKPYRIGTPVRWQKKVNAINAMKLYNATVENVFQYLTIGHLIYVQFASLQTIKKLNIDITSGQLNAIAIPIKYNSSQIFEAFQRYGISFDKEKQWNNIFNKTCQRLLNGIKDASQNG